jgi:hypothetical protein
MNHLLYIYWHYTITRLLYFYVGGGRGCDRTVVGFRTICTISAYPHWSCEIGPRLWRGVLDKTSCGFLRILRFPPRGSTSQHLWWKTLIEQVVINPTTIRLINTGEPLRYTCIYNTYLFAGDDNKGMSYNDGQMFSTKDNDLTNSCTSRRLGAWWYTDCSYVNLNGPWLPGTNGWETMMFDSFRGQVGLTKTSMKLKRK